MKNKRIVRILIENIHNRYKYLKEPKCTYFSNENKHTGYKYVI